MIIETNRPVAGPSLRSENQRGVSQAVHRPVSVTRAAPTPHRRS